jgi:hypothetical protein
VYEDRLSERILSSPCIHAGLAVATKHGIHHQGAITTANNRDLPHHSPPVKTDNPAAEEHWQVLPPRDSSSWSIINPNYKSWPSTRPIEYCTCRPRQRHARSRIHGRPRRSKLAGRHAPARCFIRRFDDEHRRLQRGAVTELKVQRLRPSPMTITAPPSWSRITPTKKCSPRLVGNQAGLPSNNIRYTYDYSHQVQPEQLR